MIRWIRNFDARVIVLCESVSWYVYKHTGKDTFWQAEALACLLAALLLLGITFDLEHQIETTPLGVVLAVALIGCGLYYYIRFLRAEVYVSRLYNRRPVHNTLWVIGRIGSIVIPVLLLPVKIVQFIFTSELDLSGYWVDGLIAATLYFSSCRPRPPR